MASALDVVASAISTLEGAMLVARPYGDPERFRAAAQRLLATLDGEPPPGVEPGQR